MLFKDYITKYYDADLKQFTAWCFKNLNDKKQEPYDLFQNVILKILDSKKQIHFESKQKVIDYLWISLRNEVFNINTKLKEGRKEQLDINEFIDFIVMDSENYRDKEKKEIVFDGIFRKAKELSDPMQFHCFKYKIVNDCSFDQMAIETGFTRSYCQKKYYECLKKLKTYFENATIYDILNFDLITDDLI